jgi:hypothetical protein
MKLNYGKGLYKKIRSKVVTLESLIISINGISVLFRT